MCGILGELDSRRRVDRERFRAMLETLRSRGPDGEGTYYSENGTVALGHRRLSIIDLSDAGRQPMANEDDTVWLVFNGEVYNYKALRLELEGHGHHFRSRTDSEVILHGYEQWGDDVVERLRGIFAFGIWDGRRRRLLLGRDRMGVKPLYYAARGDSFRFASQPRALFDSRYAPEVDTDAFSLYLAYGYVPGGRAIYRGMSKLPMGCRLTLERGRVQVSRYWRPRYNPVISQPDEAVEFVRSRLEEAVVEQMVADVPLGVFLSGGIDSSTVSAITAVRSREPVDSFTVGFEDPAKDERVYAEIAARAFSTNHHVEVMDYRRGVSLVEDFAAAFDEPFYDSSGLPTLAVSQLARRGGRKVILSGDGGDELFAGYHRYEQYLTRCRRGGLRRLLGRLPRLPLNSLSPRSGAGDPVGSYFDLVGFLSADEQRKVVAKRLRGCLPDHLQPLADAHCRGLPPVTAAQLMDLQTYLVDDILTKVDRASMFHGVEVRVPLLDHRLVEACLSVESELHHAASARKSLLKMAARRWVPDAILTPRKKGFSIPLTDWMRQGLMRTTSDRLPRGALVELGLLDPDGVAVVLRRGVPNVCWLLLSAELWARRWLGWSEGRRARLCAEQAPASSLG